MLTKLLKYEFKATARVMVPLCILSIALASVTQITLWTFLDETGSSPYSVTLILLIATAAAMGAVLAATVVLIVQRFRGNGRGRLLRCWHHFPDAGAQRKASDWHRDR